jgi:hypothetical protein
VRKNTRVEKLARTAQDNAFALAGLVAKGADGAAVELYKTAALATGWLTYLCKVKPHLFTGIAEKKFSWPLMYSPQRDAKKEDADLIKKIRLAARTNFNLFSGKTFSWRRPANVVALNLHELAQSLRRAPMRSWTSRDLGPIAVCGVGLVSSGVHIYDAKYEKQLKELEAWGQRGAGRQLPPLSKGTAAAWAKATPELFRLVYREKFDEHPKLQKLRASVLGRARDAYGKQGGPGIIRKAMLQAVKQAWSSIAALD